jgi:hypothetical protein
MLQLIGESAASFRVRVRSHTAMKNIFLLVIVLMGSSALAHGQTAEELRAKLKTLPDGKNYNVRYDKVYKITRIRSAPIQTPKPDPAVFALVAIYGTDTLKKTIQTFYLRFPFNYGMWSSPKNRVMHVVIDGETVELEEGSFGSDQYINDMPVGGQIDFRVSRDLVERMSNAQTVTVNFKTKDRTVDDKGKQIFKEMLGLTAVN